jgi:hypothetical protein
MTRWTEAQVVKVAPDDASLAAARKLSRAESWSETGSTDILVWGKCQGSGKAPYQVSVDLTEPAFRCSCPSRKFPCKHALALLLLWVAGSGSVAEVDQPAGFAQEWADDRADRAIARVTRRETAMPPDPVAQAKRLEDRLVLMSSGMDDFALWLADLVRAGTAAAHQQPYAWWDAEASRLVDSQLPGLADQVRSMASDVHRRSDWADHLLAVCGRWWTATRAWAAREGLDAHAIGDLRAFIGWAQPTAEVRVADTRSGRFLVLGSHRSDDGRLQQQRTWLRDEENGEVLQVLDFAVAGAALAVAQLAGTVLKVTVSRYPGSSPRRALFADEPESVGRAIDLPDLGSVDDALGAAASRLAERPWSNLVPVLLAGVWVCPGEPAHVRDPNGGRLDLVPETPHWTLLAFTGGRATDLFGELDESLLRPLSVVGDEGLVAL